MNDVPTRAFESFIRRKTRAISQMAQIVRPPTYIKKKKARERERESQFRCEEQAAATSQCPWRHTYIFVRLL